MSGCYFNCLWGKEESFHFICRDFLAALDNENGSKQNIYHHLINYSEWHPNVECTHFHNQLYALYHIKCDFCHDFRSGLLETLSDTIIVVLNIRYSWDWTISSAYKTGHSVQTLFRFPNRKVSFVCWFCKRMTLVYWSFQISLHGLGNRALPSIIVREALNECLFDFFCILEMLLVQRTSWCQT